MVYDLSNPYKVQAFKDKVADVIAKGYVVTLNRKLPQRSNSQNAYLHVLFGYFGSEYGASREQVKYEIYKKTCNPDLFIEEKTNKRGQTIKRIRSSADLTTGEMTLSIERFRNWSAAVAGIYLPAPNETQALLYCESVCEENEEFL